MAHEEERDELNRSPSRDEPTSTQRRHVGPAFLIHPAPDAAHLAGLSELLLKRHRPPTQETWGEQALGFLV